MWVKPLFFICVSTRDDATDEVFLALGWHLEEIHLTWAYLEKKRIRLRLYTKYLEEGVPSIKRRRRDLQSNGVKDFVTELERSRLKEDLESSTWRRQEGWNDPVVSKEESLDYENPDLKQLLGVMECKVGTLMEKEISLIGKSESVFGMSSNMMRQLPPEPSCHEAFDDLVNDFISRSKKERVQQTRRVHGSN
ncbi:hypothetical protein Tco_1217633 [Tanacetum coccineum]